MGLTSILLLGFLAIIVLFVLHIARKFHRHSKYFKKHKIPYLGAGLHRFYKLFNGSLNLAEMEQEIYKEAITATASNNAPLVGFSDIFAATGIYLTDLEQIKKVYVKDFDHFVNRRPVAAQQANFYFKRTLFGMDSEQWKGVRGKLSPSFTTGKIRRMFQIFRKSSENMADYVKNQMEFPENNTAVDIDFSKIFPKYAMDVIAGCAFGIDSKNWEVPIEEMSTFEKMGQEFKFSFDLPMLFRLILTTISPKLANMLLSESKDVKAQNYFVGVIKDVVKRRRQNGERMEDFLQMMMDAQEGLLKADEEANQVMNGSLLDSDSQDSNVGGLSANSKVIFDDDNIVANSLQFLLGGFDTTQSLLLFSLYSLAVEPEVQQKLYDEVSSKMENNGGKLTYEDVFQMTYLDMVINETLRLYPPATRTERCCTRDYPVPGTDFVIKKDTIIGIPIFPVHHDPKYFPDPEKFMPERFTAENKATRSPYAFMPFGHGPRNCIGMRFALTKVKTAIAQLVYTFEFGTCSKTKIPMEFDMSANLRPKGGMWLKVTSRLN